MLAVPGILSTYFSSPVLMNPVILEVKSKKFIVHSPAGFISDTRQSDNSLSSIYKNNYPKKLPKFQFKILMIQ